MLSPQFAPCWFDNRGAWFTIVGVAGGKVTKLILVYLIGVSAKNQGKLGTDFQAHSYTYEHAIATYALAEAYTFCNIIGYEIEGLENAVKLAGDIIVKGQNNAGMWDYAFKPGSRRDLSTSAWCMQALKAIKSTGLKINGLRAAAAQP